MKALISTLSASFGGVPSMIDFVAKTLRAGGVEPVLAYYQPFRWSPELSVPSYCLLHRRVKARTFSAEGYAQNAIGAWLPELEFTHYLPTRHWKRLIAECDFHLGVSGNCLAATPFALTGKPFWAWVATPWEADRKERVASFSTPRRLLDTWFNGHVIRALERKILREGTIVALSEYTRTHLDVLASKQRDIDVMPSGIDTTRFTNTGAERNTRKRIGFVGRATDPRKNVGLLLKAVHWCRRHGMNDLELVLIGGNDEALQNSIAELQLQRAVTVIERMDHEELPRHLSSMDLFIIPSHQEGLCIAALEAMSCGVPVISTPCGGPEEFVIDGKTGFICEPRPETLGRTVRDILANPDMRLNLGANARRLVEDRYSIDAARKKFWETFARAFSANWAALATSPWPPVRRNGSGRDQATEVQY